MKDTRAVEPLITVLKNRNNDYDMMKTTADGLAKIGIPAFAPLIAALKENYTWVSGILVKIGPPVVSPLISELLNGDKDRRPEVIGVLSRLGDHRAVDPLIATLFDDDSRVRRSAVDGLDKLNWQPGGDTNGAMYWIIKEQYKKCISIGGPAFQLLLVLLKDVEKNMGESAAEALGQFGDPRVVEPLIDAFKDKDTGVRRAAAKALGSLKDVRAVEPLIAMLESSEDGEAAAEALGKFGDARAVEPLIAALKNGSTDVQMAAAEALGKIDFPALEPFFAALKDQHKFVRKAIAEALGKTGDTRAVGPLLVALNDWDSVVRMAAACALGNIGDIRAVEPLITLLKSKDKVASKAAAETLVKLYRGQYH